MVTHCLDPVPHIGSLSSQQLARLLLVALSASVPALSDHLVSDINNTTTRNAYLEAKHA